MIGFQRALKIAPAMSNLMSKRTLVSGVPRGKLSKLEKYVLGTTLIVGISAVPAYILVNLKYYNGKVQA